MISPLPQGPEHYLATVTELAAKLTDVVTTAPAHSMGLDALLMAFHAVALSHPCCTRAAALSAMRHANQLLQATQQPGFGHTTH